MELHVEILHKEGKNEFAVLPYEEFVAIQERLADAEDVLALRQAKADEGDSPTKSLAEVNNEIASGSD